MRIEIPKMQNSERIDYCRCSCMEEDRLYLRGLLASFRPAGCEDAWRMLWKGGCQVWGQPAGRDGAAQRAGARGLPKERWEEAKKRSKTMGVSTESFCPVERIIDTSPEWCAGELEELGPAKPSTQPPSKLVSSQGHQQSQVLICQCLAPCLVPCRTRGRETGRILCLFSTYL